MKEAVQLHKDQFIEELKQYLSIPSISSLSKHKEDVQRAADWTANALKDAGMENVEVIPTNGHPVVYGDYLHAEGKPTVLVYGHYDVQPEDPVDLWDTPPFDPVIRDGKLYARGATDDKGQLFIHIKAVDLLMKEEGELPVNVKFVIEGEEEIASPNLAPFISENEGKLACDAVVISDTSFSEKGQPALCTSLRGALAMELTVSTANSDLHSGTYGGGVPNSIHALVQLLDSLHGKDGKIAVDGFYDGVPEPTEALRNEVAEVPFNEERTKQELDLEDLYGEEGFTFQERVGIRPTLEINGITGGFQGEGLKTIVPKQASAKISCRLVGEQDPQAVYEAIENHINKNKPVGAKVGLHQYIKADPVAIDSQNSYIQAAADAFENVYDVRPLFPKEGGSIPIVEVFGRVLDAPVVLMGFGLPTENLHAPNEHFHLENFTKGIETVCEYFKKL
ncbi:Acetylornithine deacetylase/Succinyl-diaminopimelate desuccinylase [Halobacillus dabanensis]|uniref:Acetylornithine deacetylase/Succinyl-diaminopimelate desuccinylase n=1 Tax=Halobacillus dabanensis TaxID=240302 RepID=A0A1I4AC16_HALDA|nr:dipeptidase [Halobacillus dabanensis]SFK53935.1 Acetylornithine deacetylase/Succinyl-diaminopimelate desuccinylase [Halobacillus dabanensis]